MSNSRVRDVWELFSFFNFAMRPSSYVSKVERFLFFHAKKKKKPKKTAFSFVAKATYFCRMKLIFPYNLLVLIASVSPLIKRSSSLLAPVCSDSRFEASEYIAESGFFQSITLADEKPIAISRSKFQEIAIYRSEHYGKVLMLDGVIQLTERDANAYNEMMAHPAMFSHPNPKRVLVIGGGDGYVVSEVSIDIV